MCLWNTMLQDIPATLQILIARSNRISLPRNAPAEERQQRLHAALCHRYTVQTTYASLDEPVRDALQDLRTCFRGISLDDLTARYGPLRPWKQIKADPKPCSTTEQLILLGWLLPRPTKPHQPTRYYLPWEVRQWLPVPLRLETLGPAPTILAIPPIIHATIALLLACAEKPCTIRADGMLRRATLRMLASRLPFAISDTGRASLYRFLVPLLTRLALHKSLIMAHTISLLPGNAS